MLTAIPPATDLRRHLQRGGLVVVRCATGQPVEPTRQLGRACCARLLAALAEDGVPPLRHVSRSATDGLAAVALAQAAPVGVDVERLRLELLDDDLSAAALHPSERTAPCTPERFFALWVRKEAVLKAMGIGLALAPASFAAGPASARWTTLRPDGARRVRVRSLGATQGVHAAVATLGDEAALWCIDIDARTAPA